jgi:hypothetical protein
MARTPRRQQPDSRTRRFVRIPKRDLAESVLHLAAPLLEPLGAAPALADARRAVEIAINLWNAHVAVGVSEIWGTSRPRTLDDLRAAMCGTQSPPALASAFEVLSARWKKEFALEPRLVGTWSIDLNGSGKIQLVCEMTLPDGFAAEVPPPAEKRIAIGGRFLDETTIPLDASSLLSFPVEQHRGVVSADGTATVYTKMPTALQLFAEGRLPRVGGDAVQVSVGGKDLGSMVLAEVRCGGQLGYHDVAVLEFLPAQDKDVRSSAERMMTAHERKR